MYRLDFVLHIVSLNGVNPCKIKGARAKLMLIDRWRDATRSFQTCSTLRSCIPVTRKIFKRKRLKKRSRGERREWIGRLQKLQLKLSGRIVQKHHQAILEWSANCQRLLTEGAWARDLSKKPKHAPKPKLPVERPEDDEDDRSSSSSGGGEDWIPTSVKRDGFGHISYRAVYLL
jgi:hypothetical protein